MAYQIKPLRMEWVADGTIPRPIDCLFQVSKGDEVRLVRVQIPGHGTEFLGESGWERMSEADVMACAKDWLCSRLGKKIFDPFSRPAILKLPAEILEQCRILGSIPPHL